MKVTTNTIIGTAIILGVGYFLWNRMKQKENQIATNQKLFNATTPDKATKYCKEMASRSRFNSEDSMNEFMVDCIDKRSALFQESPTV